MLTDIILFFVCLFKGDRRKTEAASAQLAKEIQLKHRAPVVSMNVIDSNCASLGDVLGDSGTTTAPAPGPHRVVISSEEQFKVSALIARREPFYLGFYFRRLFSGVYFAESSTVRQVPVDGQHRLPGQTDGCHPIHFQIRCQLQGKLLGLPVEPGRLPHLESA